MDLMTGELKLKKSSHYYFQIQGQLNVTGASKCYFIIFTKKWMSVEEIDRDSDFWREKMIPQLKKFYEEALLPEIVQPLFPKRMLKTDIREASYVQK